jgi:hypothetical protein
LTQGVVLPNMLAVISGLSAAAGSGGWLTMPAMAAAALA